MLKQTLAVLTNTIVKKYGVFISMISWRFSTHVSQPKANITIVFIRTQP